MPTDLLPIAGGLLAWLLTYALHSTLLLGSAWLFCRWRRSAAAWRDLACRVALVAGFMTSTLGSGLGWEPLAGRVALSDEGADTYKLYAHQNEDIVRLTPAELKAKMAAKERA